MKTKLRICFLSPVHWSARMGGAEYQMQLLIDQMICQDRFDISYLARLTAVDTSAYSYSIYNIQNRVTTRISYGLDALRIWKLLRRLKPQLIYQRVGCAYSAISAYYGRRFGIPTIWHISHDKELTSNTAVGSSAIPGLDRLERRLLDYGIRNSTHIVAQTKSQASTLKKFFGRDASCIIANYHPAPDVHPSKSRCPINVTWVANLKAIKRPELFMQLVRDFRGRDSVVFTMIGPQSDSNPYGAELTETSLANPNFRYLGHCSQSEVNSVLAKSHIFVSTSEQEGFPNTFIQAWMRRVPVVSLGVDPDGVIAANDLGIVCDNYEALRSAVSALIVDEPRRRILGENVFRHATAVHSMSNALQLSSLISTAAESLSTRKLDSLVHEEKVVR